MTDKLEYRTKCLIPTVHGDFDMHLFVEEGEGVSPKEHLALVMGDVRGKVDVLARIHSECCTGDIFGCQRCDCQDQLHKALEMIGRKKQGALFYLRQEGRGIGLENKLKAYELQDKGMDTVEANLALGFKADYRDYSIAAEMAQHLGIKGVHLISNNTNKVRGIESAGIEVRRRVPIVINSPIRDRMELFRTKQKKLGHLFDKLDEIKVIDDEQEFPLSFPGLFSENAKVPEVSRQNTKEVIKALTDKL